MKKPILLEPEKIIRTIERLERRINDRFPQSGLLKVCANFLEITRDSQKNIQWISTPNLTIRMLSYLVILISIGVVIYSFSYIDFDIQNTKLTNIVTMTESLINELILIGAAIFFLITVESKIKRRRAQKSLNELRVIVHVVDMHQLTKDPSLIFIPKSRTKSSPDRNLTKFELERYLDYCSELSSLIAKVAALYAQSLPDQIVVRSVNEIEVLSTGLSRKIWQKLIILNEKNPPKKTKILDSKEAE